MLDFNRRVLPVSGETWRHFKGKYYEILHLATNVNTNGMVVVYRKAPQYNDRTVWVRNLEEFMSEVDRAKYPLDKYPEYVQQYRFERVPNNENVYGESS